MGPSQTEVSEWLVERFGPDRDIEAQMDKVREEVEELADAIREITAWGTDRPRIQADYRQEWEQNLRDEAADVVLTIMAIAVTEKFSLASAVADKWRRRKRGAALAAGEGETATGDPLLPDLPAPEPQCDHPRGRYTWDGMFQCTVCLVEALPRRPRDMPGETATDARIDAGFLPYKPPPVTLTNPIVDLLSLKDQLESDKRSNPHMYARPAEPEQRETEERP